MESHYVQVLTILLEKNVILVLLMILMPIIPFIEAPKSQHAKSMILICVVLRTMPYYWPLIFHALALTLHDTLKI